MPADGMIAAAEKGIRHIPRWQLYDYATSRLRISERGNDTVLPSTRTGRYVCCLAASGGKADLEQAALNELNCEHTN
jgi:hypothetical protein